MEPELSKNGEKVEGELSEGSIFKGPTESSLKDLTVGKLLDTQSRQNPDKVAVVSRWQGTSLTYEALHISSRKIAQRLLAHGVRPKDRVVVMAGNAIEYTQLFFAVGGIGAVFAIVNPTFTQDEALAAVEFLNPAAVFVADKIGYRKNATLLKQLAKHPEYAPLVVQLGTTEKVCENILTWSEFSQGELNASTSDLLEQSWAVGTSSDTICIQFTSGTTGPRKAAMVSHGNLLNNAFLVGERLEIVASDVICGCAPLFHCFGLVCGLLLTLMYGSTIVLPSDVFLADATLEALAENKCTVIHAVSSMLQAILDLPNMKSQSSKVSLRTGIIAGSSFSKNLLVQLSANFGLKDLAYGYGMTELSCIAFLTTPSKVSLFDNNTSVGTVMSHAYAKVVDSNLSTLPPGSSGELLVSGYSVFQGYYKNPEKTNEAIIKDSQGREWLRTGDLVTIDTLGRCTIIGRVKDMIKRGGENIFPSDIEQVLESHPGIKAAAVIGVQDPYWGEIVGAFVQRNQGFEIDEKGLKSWLRTRIAPHKVPERYFWIGEGSGLPDSLPVNATGKIEKVKLRDIANSLVTVRA
ncbi:long-chain-fatty-acid- ligase protein [Rutstroemia sp. NJR-2017a WRK4]|nr:long-chain-fatty-acid- ligase protein [Rutstroemia sp. NJR-2017a WRK4]